MAVGAKAEVLRKVYIVRGQVRAEKGSRGARGRWARAEGLGSSGQWLGARGRGAKGRGAMGLGARGRGSGSKRTQYNIH